MRTPKLMRNLFVLVLFLQFVGTHFPVYDPQPTFPHFDKILHFSAYLVLMVLFRINWPRASFAWSIACAAMYGAFDEITQSLAVGRQADYFDWIADICGAMAGYFIYNYLKVRPPISIYNND